MSVCTAEEDGMAKLRKVRTKTEYHVLDGMCIGRGCLVLGEYQHRSMNAGGGSRNTGGYTHCCMTRAYRGCPQDTEAFEYDKAIADGRKAEGWR